MRPFALFALLALLPFAPSARAASSYDSCTGFITSLPAYITTQGTWCMNKDLSTTMTAGEAILVDANNVTIDCNGFKLGGLGAGPDTGTAGIATLSRLNTTVRGCNIRGFYIGLWADAGGGHVFEDNRLEANTFRGIYTAGTSGIVRRNLLLDNGAQGAAPSTAAMYVAGSVDVLDNTIDGVAPVGPGDISAFGLVVQNNPDGIIDGNRIRGLAPSGTFIAAGIVVSTPGRVLIRNNQLVGTGVTNSVAISCSSNTASAMQNQIAGFDYGVSSCQSDGDVINSN
jgi:hypothetical protein